MVNPLGLKEASLYNQKGAIGAPQQFDHAQAAPNFGRREQVDLCNEDFNLAEPSARNPRESADLTIDMLGGKEILAARRQPSDEAPNHL